MKQKDLFMAFFFTEISFLCTNYYLLWSEKVEVSRIVQDSSAAKLERPTMKRDSRHMRAYETNLRVVKNSLWSRIERLSCQCHVQGS